MTSCLVHSDRDVEAGMHEDMYSASSSASSSSTQLPRGSAGRNKVHAVQDIGLQERKIRSAVIESPKSQFSDRDRFESTPLGSRTDKTAGYSLHLRHLLPWVQKDVKPAALLLDEDKLQTHERIRSIKMTYEEAEAETAVEQDEWGRELKDRSHRR